jgi:hypothetical protein
MQWSCLFCKHAHLPSLYVLFGTHLFRLRFILVLFGTPHDAWVVANVVGTLCMGRCIPSNESSPVEVIQLDGAIDTDELAKCNIGMRNGRHAFTIKVVQRCETHGGLNS